MSRKITKVALTGPERSAKKMLDQIVKFINAQDSESQKLWNILTALRGPDSHDTKLKDKTTARLRYKIGLKPNDNFSTSPEPLSRYIDGDAYNDHFLWHFNDAVRVLREFQLDEQEEINAKLDALSAQFDSNRYEPSCGKDYAIRTGRR